MSDKTHSYPNPILAFDKDGQAAVLNYNLPTSSSYHGIGFIELDVPAEWFTEAAKRKPDRGLDGGGIDRWPPDIQDPLSPIKNNVMHRQDELRELLQPDVAEKYNEVLNLLAGLARQVWRNKWDALRQFLDKARELALLGKIEEDWYNKVVVTALNEAWDNVATYLRNTSLWRQGYEQIGVHYSNIEIPNEKTNQQGGQQLPKVPRMLTGGEETDQGVLAARQIVQLAREGKRVVPVMRQSGRVVGMVVKEPEEPHPRLAVVEYYRLTSFLGDYGAGQTLNTFTLLPGEESTITVRTWKQMAETRLVSSSILDSYDDNVAEEFEESVQREQTRRDQSNESSNWEVSASASASWFWGSASFSGKSGGSTSQAREQGARNVDNALTKHASKASHQRKVEINSSTEQKTEEGEEVLINRTIKNINLSRVMNFVFRQLNQEFICYQHLVDLRIAFTNGYSDAVRTVTLPELDILLNEFIVPERHDEVKNWILEEYQKKTRNFRDQTVSLIEQAPDGYLRVRYGHLSPTQGSPAPGKEPDPSQPPEVGKVEEPGVEDSEHPQLAARVPGIILSKSTHVLPTDAVIVDALLGGGVALDDYALDSQRETLRTVKSKNELAEAEAAKLQLALKIIRDKDAQAAELFKGLFPPPPTEGEHEHGP